MLNNLRPFIQPAAINFFYGGMEVLKLVLKSVNVVLDISVSGPSMLFQTSCSLLSAMLVHPKNTLALFLCDLLEATTCPLKYQLLPLWEQPEVVQIRSPNLTKLHKSYNLA